MLYVFVRPIERAEAEMSVKVLLEMLLFCAPPSNDTPHAPSRVNVQPSKRAPRVISDCQFSVLLDHFIPVFLSYSVAVFLK
jgi:hypothetical protein